MNATENERITAAFKCALKAALEFAQEEDSGTCNLDTSVVFPGKNRKAYVNILDQLGIPYYESELRGKKALFLSGMSPFGQAYLRTKMAEAATKVLKDYAKMDATMYYQMD